MRKLLSKHTGVSPIILLMILFVLILTLDTAFAEERVGLNDNSLTSGLYTTQFKVSGIVANSLGDPLIGVSVQVKGTSAGTTTDAQGHFQIDASKNATLVFSYVGYQSKEVAVNGRETLNVVLSSSAQELNQLVVIGYGTQKKSDLTGSLGSVDEKTLERISPANVQGALEGRIAGVNVIQGSGRPGGNPKIRVRGFTSITGSNNPLYVVDGVIINNGGLANNTSPIDYLNPQSIKSISVLKGPSATAIYGSRGANGVVVITTKNFNGQTLHYNGSISIGTLPRELDLLNAEQFLNLEDIAYQNAEKYGLKNSITDPAIKRANTPRLFDENGNPLYNTDWQKAGTRTAVSQNHSLSFGGGNSNTNYTVGLGYKNNEGLLVGSFAKLYSGRLSVNSQINDWLTAGGAINYSLSKQRMTKLVGQGGLSAPRQIIESLPIIPVKYPDGTFANNKDYPGMDGGGQPVRLSQQKARILNTNNTIGNAHLKIKLAKGLTFKTTLGVNITDQKFKYFAAPGLQWISTDGNASISSQSYKSWQEESQFDYKAELFDNHSLEALLAASWQKVNSFGFNAAVSNLNTLFYKYNNLGAASVSSIPGSNAGSFSLNSYFGRIHYSINNKYLFTLTGRLDGSSKFSRDNQYGFFPSVAFAWNVAQENFLKNSAVISNMKLRAGYGVTGNSQIPNYRTVTALGNFSYIIDGKLASGVGVGSLANPDLKWEKDVQYNIGIDLGLFEGRLNFTGDIYYKKSSNILLNAPIPATSGYTTIIRNIGSMENKGVELSLNTVNIKTADFGWNTSFTISMNRNKIIHLVGGQDIFGGGHTIIREGEPVNSFYGYVILGTWGTDQKAEAAKYGELPGDLIFKDLNNDGEINVHDEKIIGNGLPKGTGALINTFDYKNFQLVLNLRYSFGNDINWTSRYSFISRTGISNSLAEALNAWTPDHQDTYIPQIRPNAGYVKPQAEKSLWIYDGSFIRGNLRISYQLPSKLINRWDIKSLGIYLASDNLFLITSYPGFDPEVSSVTGNFTQGIDSYAYPRPRTFRFGISLSL